MGRRAVRNRKRGRTRIGEASALVGLLLALAPAAQAASITASWVGGTGDYEDPAGWLFDAPPTAATIPDNDGTDFFGVLIDGGSAAVQSQVSVGAPIRIDSLAIDAGDELRVLEGNAFTVVRSSARPGSGVVRNDGTLLLEAAGAGAAQDTTLGGEGDLRFDGGGVLRLSGGSRAVVDASASTLANEEGHRIEGAGTLRAFRLENRGTIAATDVDALQLDFSTSFTARFRNEGTLEASGAGGLDLGARGFTNQGLVRVLSGSTLSAESIDNDGLVEVLSGGRLVLNFGTNDSTGVLRVSGAGSEASLSSSFTNRGLTEILDGGRLAAAGLSQSTFDALLRVGSGSELALGDSFSSLSAGVVELDDGLLSSKAGVRFRSSALLSGTGQLSLPGQELELSFGGTVSPGLGGAGLLELDGGLVLAGRFLAELGGALPAQYDRLTVSEAASLGGSTIEVSLLDGFAPAFGDAFDLITAQTVTSSESLDALFALPELGGELFLIPSIATGASTQSLRLSVAERLEAIWVGGVGSYADPGQWLFSDTPVSATFPSNDGSNLFQVRIDGGQDGTASAVSLATDVVIDRLEIDTGDSLTVADGSSLTLDGAASRPGSGVLVNDGTLALDAAGAQTGLLARGDLTLSGRGVLRLSDSAQNLVGDEDAELVNELGHRIEGAGTIRGERLENRGTLAATGSQALRLELSNNLLNEGTVEASGAGGLDLGVTGFTNAGLLRVVSAGSLSAQFIQNRGTSEVLSGGRLLLGGSLSNERGAVFRVSGAGSQASLGPSSTLTNRGLTEILDGGRVTARGLSHFGSSALLRIGSGSELALGSSGGTVSGGVLELDGGLLSSGGQLRVSSGTLRGNGRLSLPGQELELRGTLSPGLDGAGLIELDGRLDFRGRFLAELGGTLPGAYDRLTVSESALLDGGTIEVSLLGFAPQRGDAFDLVTAQTLTSSRPLDDLLAVPELGGDLFLVPRIAVGAGTESLRLSVLEQLEATWSGGAGSYGDPGRWLFSGTPVSATFPSNDDANLFRVRIDGGQDGTASAVSLATDVAVDRLEIDAGDSFTLADGSSLTLEGASNRPGSGVLVNDGRLALDGAGSETGLRAGSDLTLAGAGVLELSDSAQNLVGGEGFELVNEADHRIEGAGTLRGERLENRGTLAATGSQALRLELSSSFESLLNRGTVEASGAGGLELGTGDFENRGLLRVLPGSSLSAGSLANEESAEVLAGGSLLLSSSLSNGRNGTFRVSGAGSQVTVGATLGNSGLFEILGGARVSARGLSSRSPSSSLVRIGPGSELALGTSGGFVSSGAVELDDGLLSSSGRLRLSSGTLRGNGMLVLPGQELELIGSGTLSPGLGGAGLLELDGRLDFRGRLLAELGGTLPAEIDRLIVSETATLASGGTIEVSLLDGFAPQIGDAFDLITARTVTSSVALDTLFELPELGEEVFLVPRISSDATTQSLRLAVAERLEAIWRGGTGGYTDPGQWLFSGTPVSATFPSNDDTNFFRVKIDGGQGGTASVVSLATDVTIDRLEIDAGDSLTVADGSSLTLERDRNRPGSGVLVNDGTLALDAAGFETALLASGDLTLSGRGVLRLSDSAQNLVGDADVELANEAGHRIEGAGTLRAFELSNRGIIAATAVEALRLEYSTSFNAGFRNEGTLEASGAGGLDLGTRGFTNDGLVSVLPGSSFSAGFIQNNGVSEVLSGGSLGLASALQNNSGGVFRVSGAGSLVDLGTTSTFTNRGLTEILGGARVSARSLSQSSSSTALLRISAGSELALGSSGGSIRSGVFELDGGLLSSDGGLRLSGGVLTGNGTLSLPGEELEVTSSGTLSPGLDGAGLLELDGELDFSGRFLAELGGALPAEFDRVTVSETAILGSGGRIEVSLLDGFAPERGDAFDLVTALSLTSTQSLGSLFELPELGGELFFVPLVASEATSESLRLSVAERLQATWTGGAGSYDDAGRWLFSDTPVSATFPSNDETNLFQVRIDGGQDGAVSAVSLATDVEIDRLEIDAGDSLSVVDGSTLTLAGGGSRPDSGVLVNDGTVSIDGAGSETGLLADGDLTLSGSGLLRLSDDAGNLVGSEEADLVNEAGHRIEGAGTIRSRALVNRGTVAATGARSLLLEYSPAFSAGFRNEGDLEASGAGGLDLGTRRFSNEGRVAVDGSSLRSGVIENDGRLEILAGGRLHAAGVDNDPTGEFLASGVGTEVELTGSLINAGLTEVVDGARLTARSLSQGSGSPELLVGEDSELVLTGPFSNSIRAGTVELSQGMITSGSLSVSSSGALVGDGVITTSGLSVSGGGRISPGDENPGLLEVFGALGFSGRFQAGLQASASDAFDRIAVSENASITGGSVEVELLEGFDAVVGDGFDLLTARTLVVSASLDDIVQLPDLEGGLFLVPRILAEGGSESLRLDVRERLLATWTGGDGSYTDPGQWVFDGSPVSATFPSNDFTNLFQVTIDGAPGIDSGVSLDTDVAIDRLDVTAGDRLTVQSGASLTLDRGANRPDSGVLVNDGVIALEGGAEAAELRAEDELVLEGSGVLSLAGSGENRVGGGSLRLTNEATHAVEGAGRLEGGSLTNRGRITADGSGPLTLSFNGRLGVSNSGQLEATGGGTLRVDVDLDNRGLLRVDPGSTLEGEDLSNLSGASTRVTGVGSELRLSSTLAQSGLLEILEGGRVVTGRFVQSNDAAVTRVGEGSLLALTGSNHSVSAGLFQLDGGEVAGDTSILFSSASALEGDGRFSLDLRVAGRLSPGLTGAGLIEVTGDFDLSGLLQSELLGTGLDAYDRVTVGGDAELGGAIEVSLREGFEPGSGDFFDLVTAGSVSASVPLQRLLELPDLDGDLFLVSGIRGDGATESLRLSVAEGVEATWTGGAGSYTDPSRWSFDRPPASATIPSNDETNLFRVRVDGDSGSASAVALDTDVAIDALEIDAGDGLTVEDGAFLTVASAPNRQDSGRILNDGTLAVAAGAAPTGIRADGDLSFAGTGVLALSDSESNEVGGSLFDLSNESGHRVEGAGTIRARRLENRGTVAALGANPLRLAAEDEILNEGRLEARGVGGLSLDAALENEGLVRVDAGSSLRTGFVSSSGAVLVEEGTLDSSSSFSNAGSGSLRVTGSGSDASFASSLSNAGHVEVADGGRLSARGLTHSLDSAFTRIAGGSELVIGTSGLSLGSGVLELDGGIVTNAAGALLSGAELRGNGLLSQPGRTLDVRGSGVLSPGLGDAGLLELDGRLDFSGLLLAELGGDALEAYDRLVVSESADFEAEGRIDVSLIEGFAPELGDQFDLVRAESLTTETRLNELFSLPELASDGILAPSLVGDPGDQRLRVSVLQGVDATWTGGTGDYTDPGSWSFSAPPAGAFFPSNDDANLFQVRIDGAPGTDSDVLLSEAVEIDRLEIAAGDRLTLEDGGRLAIARASNRPGSGAIANEGLLRIEAGGTETGIDFEGLTFSGGGTLQLSDDASNRVAALGENGVLVNESEHRIEGAGTLAGFRLENRGTIVANGTERLVLDFDRFGGSVNGGTLEARDGGFLDLDSMSFVNEGLLRADGGTISTGSDNAGSVEVRAGGRFENLIDFRFANSGTASFRVTGAGSEAIFRDRFDNGGLLEVSEGGRLVVPRLDQSGRPGFGGLTRVASGGEIVTSSGFLSELELDAGVLRADTGFSVDELRGNGLLSVESLRLRTVSPGLSGVGRIDVEGELEITRLLAELAGTRPEDYDRVEVTGDATLDPFFGVGVELSLADAFAPERGDRFDLLTADTVEVDGRLSELLSLPALDDELFFVAGIVDGAASQSLRVGVLEGIEAVWTGGAGRYDDPGRWSFDRTPVSAAFPSNDESNLFRVRIDGGAAVDSDVSLDRAVAIDRLEIATGDALRIEGGASLDIETAPNRPGSGVIANEGLLTLLGASELGFDGDLTLVGGGQTLLSGGRIVAREERSTLVQEAGHGIEGAGTIEALELVNRGTVATSVASPLVLTGLLTNEGGVEVSGPGDLRVQSLRNAGTTSVAAGARLRSSGFVDNLEGATLRVSGAGSRVEVTNESGSFSGGFGNAGRVELLDGARLETGRFSQFGSEASTRVAGGAELAIGDGFSSGFGGTVELDDGVVSSLVDIALLGELTGNGRVSLPGRTLETRSSSVLAPGLAGVGRLEIDGALEHEGRLLSEVAGPGVGDFDRLEVSGPASVERNGSFEVGLLDGFAPGLGARFDLLTAPEIATERPLAQIFELPELAGDLFLVPEIAGPEGARRLEVAVLEALDATWTGGSGSYTDPLRWSFSSTPAGATIPSNDGTNLFRVRIDGGSAATPSEVALDAAVTIDRLEIDAGDALDLVEGARLTLASGSNRPTSGVVANDGTLRMGADGSSSELLFDRRLSLEGEGVLLLGDGGARVAATLGNTELRNGPDHRIEGSGVLESSSLVNEGTLLANGAQPLELRTTPGATSIRGFRNEGHVEASGPGGLVVDARFDNRGSFLVLSKAELLDDLSNSSDGTVQVIAGGLLEGTGLSNSSSVDVSGPGSEARFSSGLINRRLIDVSDGGRVSALALGHSSEAAVTRIADGGELALLSDSSIVEGTIELDDGTLRSDSGLSIGSGSSLDRTPRLEGNGVVSLPGRTLVVDDAGALAPGLGGVGRLELEAALSLSGRLETDIAGSDAADVDAVTVSRSASIQEGAKVAVSLLDGFDPALGESFDILTADEIATDTSLDTLLAPHALADDRFFVAKVVETDSMSLRLDVVQSVEATWNGGLGTWTDPLAWSYDGPAPPGGFPDNGENRLFRARIDGGRAGVSLVSLDEDVRIDRLEIDAGDALELGDGVALTLAGGSSRIGSGTVANDGTLRLGSRGGASELAFSGDLRLGGTGSLLLSDDAANRVGDVEGAFTLANEAGHLIEGAGRLAADRIENRGTVSATGANALVLDARSLANEGSLEALGEGGLDLAAGGSVSNPGRLRVRSGSRALVGSIFNTGRIEVSDGGRLESAPPLFLFRFRNEEGGVVQVSGAGSTASLSSALNQGLIDVGQGGSLDISSFSQFGTSPLARIGTGSEADLGFASIGSGSLRIEDGVVRAEELFVRGTGVLEGSGRIELRDPLFVEGGGRILPGGLGEVGAFEIEGDLLLLRASFGEDGELGLDIGGTSEGEFDFLRIYGSVELEGVVDVDLVDLLGGDEPFAPELGDRFDVILADSIEDRGAVFDFPVLEGGKRFESSLVNVVGGRALRFSIVPEPASGLLLALGLAGLAARRRGLRASS